MLFRSARDIHLEDVNWLFVQQGASLYVFLNRESADIGNDAAVVVALEAREFMGDDMFYAGVLPLESFFKPLVAGHQKASLASFSP